MLVDNSKGRIEENYLNKFDFVRNKMQENINQMLFYHRIKGKGKDYLFERFNLEESVNEVLLDYKALIDEKKIEVLKENLEIEVFTDKRSLEFILGQIISNSIKYSSEDPNIRINAKKVNKETIISIIDNGVGVKECDLPFIFDKGFTGDLNNLRKKSTGMGLYLAKEIASDIKIELKAFSKYEEGFKIEIKL